MIASSSAGSVHVIRVGAEPFGELDQIGRAEPIQAVPHIARIGIEILHALADHVQVVVFQHDPDRADAVGLSGRHFGAVHHEGAIAHQRHAGLVGPAHLAADHRADAEAHGPHRQRAMDFSRGGSIAK